MRNLLDEFIMRLLIKDTAIWWVKGGLESRC